MNPTAIEMIKLLLELKELPKYKELADRLIDKLLRFAESDVDAVLEKMSKLMVIKN